jgi:hypothetical protein
MQTISVGVTDFAHFVQRVELEGIVYALTFHWNARRGLWHLDCGVAGADASVAGVAIVANRFLLARYHYLGGVPPGELMALDPTALLAGPGFDWSGFTLVYFSAAEVVHEHPSTWAPV